MFQLLTLKIPNGNQKKGNMPKDLRIAEKSMMTCTFLVMYFSFLN